MTIPAQNARTLDRTGLLARLDEELSRVHRGGGFLSLALLGPVVDKGGARNPALDLAAPSLRATIRAQDSAGWWEEMLAFLLPDTDATQAVQLGNRLLRALRGTTAPQDGPWRCGVATVFGFLEGGSDAMFMAAREALGSATADTVAVSDALRGRPRVLVIDDDRAFCEALADTVTDLGWEGYPCVEASDASERIRENDYAGLIVDLVMPGKNGVELLKEALRERPRLPAVLVSGQDAGSELVIEALSLGPVMFFQKPVSRQDLGVALAMFQSLLPRGHAR